MVKQAEADEFRVYKAQLYKHLYGAQPRLNKEQLRKRSDVDPDKYNQLVVADEQEVEHEYESEYRGRVQNHKVDMAFLPMFELSYEQHRTEVKPYMAYDRQVDAYNQNIPAADHIYINCNPTVLDEKKSAHYFAYIDSLSVVISRTVDNNDVNSRLLLNRAVAYSVTQNFAAAIEDLTACLREDSTLSMAYWQRAVCQWKQNEFDASQGDDVTLKMANVNDDFTHAILYNDQCAYLYYNRANVYASRKDYARAIDDYTRALEVDRNLAEAYYNRGIARLLSEKTVEGLEDLSKAGELGLYMSYSVIKKYRK